MGKIVVGEEHQSKSYFLRHRMNCYSLTQAVVIGLSSQQPTGNFTSYEMHVPEFSNHDPKLGIVPISVKIGKRIAFLFTRKFSFSS